MDETLLANGPADLFAHIDDAGFEEPDGGCALKVVSPLENIVEDLKAVAAGQTGSGCRLRAPAQADQR